MVSFSSTMAVLSLLLNVSQSNTFNGCQETICNCEADRKCTVNCDGIDSCKSAIIRGNNAIELIIICSGQESCGDISVDCGNTEICSIDCSYAGQDACNGIAGFNCQTSECSIDCGTSADSCTSAIDPIVSNALSFGCDGRCLTSWDALVFTQSPTSNPTKTPTNNPSKNPTISPTNNPSKSPIKKPTNNPAKPATKPPTPPTPTPTLNPSKSQTNNPSSSPSNNPSLSPTNNPSQSPSNSPSKLPTNNPSTTPSKTPTTNNPSLSPSDNPSLSPTNKPTNNPSRSPNNLPSHILWIDYMNRSSTMIDWTISGSITQKTNDPGCANVAGWDCWNIGFGESIYRFIPTIGCQDMSITFDVDPWSYPNCVFSYSIDNNLDWISFYEVDNTPEVHIIANQEYLPLETWDNSGVGIKIETIGSGSDGCYVSNVMLEGTLCELPTNNPSTSPSKTPTSAPSTDPTTSSPTTNIPTILTNNPSASPTNIPTLLPTNIPSLSPSKTPSSNPTDNPTIPPTNNPSDIPTLNPTNNPSLSPTNNPSQTPTTVSPTSNPSLSPTTITLSPTTSIPTFTQSPTNNPTITTSSPSNNPSLSSTNNPSLVPTNNPSASPTDNPSLTPSTAPSNVPSLSPTNNPSLSPSNNPSQSPTTVSPSNNPSLSPTTITISPTTSIPTFTQSPTNNPTITTSSPTSSPSLPPTSNPSLFPSNTPSNNPSNNPSDIPTNTQTSTPTNGPTDNPSQSPSNIPSISPITNVPTTFNPSTTNPTTNIPTITTSNPAISITEIPTTLYPTTTNIPTTNIPTTIITLPPTPAPTLNPSESPIQSRSTEDEDEQMNVNGDSEVFDIYLWYIVCALAIAFLCFLCLMIVCVKQSRKTGNELSEKYMNIMYKIEQFKKKKESSPDDVECATAMGLKVRTESDLETDSILHRETDENILPLNEIKSPSFSLDGDIALAPLPLSPNPIDHDHERIKTQDIASLPSASNPIINDNHKRITTQDIELGGIVWSSPKKKMKVKPPKKSFNRHLRAFSVNTQKILNNQIIAKMDKNEDPSFPKTPTLLDNQSNQSYMTYSNTPSPPQSVASFKQQYMDNSNNNNDNDNYDDDDDDDENVDDIDIDIYGGGNAMQNIILPRNSTEHVWSPIEKKRVKFKYSISENTKKILNHQIIVKIEKNEDPSSPKPPIVLQVNNDNDDNYGGGLSEKSGKAMQNVYPAPVDLGSSNSNNILPNSTQSIMTKLSQPLPEVGDEHSTDLYNKKKNSDSLWTVNGTEESGTFVEHSINGLDINQVPSAGPIGGMFGDLVGLDDGYDDELIGAISEIDDDDDDIHDGIDDGDDISASY